MSIRGKIVGVAEPTVTKSRGLRVANALFADETGKIELDLWEGHACTPYLLFKCDGGWARRKSPQW